MHNETMFEYGMYGSQSLDVRTGYTNGIPTSGTSGVLGKCGAQMLVSPTLYFEYENGDQRRDVSIIDHALVMSSASDSYQLNTYAGMGVGKYRINWKKERGSSDSRRDINWPLLRYSDVLLMYAEALNELNGQPTSEAIDAIKQVRTRAFNGDASKVGAIPTSQADFRNYIIQERKLELNNEGLRKSDLLRWGIHYEHLTAELAKIKQLCNHEGKYANIKQYWAYNKSGVGTPGFNDPTISLAHIELSEDEVASLGLSLANMKTLHTLNKAGYVTAKFYEAGGKVYIHKADAPADAKEVEYTIINMWSISTVKQKGNLATVDNTDESKGMISSNNSWITGSTGIFYGMKKNMTEIIPLHATNVIDVNSGLAGQQHPAYQ